ncbi:hypothetical protein [Pimelobacter sp. 30-1]|uniref:hypothetical protein n=1 Tax=Pimelobacter sp. 30-1 TaxID=2004991 RepID=UPI001C042F43|nr:hypothetical protein [Pimelobacter sp. 30-1]MBU2698746.1 hypothetical protein [Pimelobacter sp. 30-1]
MFTTTDRRTNPTGYASHTDASSTEWGPAKHNPEHPFHRELDEVAVAVDLRDGDAARPDDN